MDLVNSVTQNSNNRNTTMENQGGAGASNNNNRDDDGDHSERAPGQTTSFDAQPGDELAMVASVEKKAQVPDYLRAIGMDPRKFWPKKYRFTREKSPGLHNPLTIAQRNFYESNGYLVLDDCVSRRLLDQIKSTKSKQFIAGQQQQQSIGVGQKQSDFVDEFLLDKLLAKNGRLSQYVKCFCDEKFMLMTSRLVEHFQCNADLAKNLLDNNSDPSSVQLKQQQQQQQQQLDQTTINEANIESHLLSGQTNRQALFRDWIYLPFRPIDKVVGTIVALEPIEHVILLVPGTHRVGQCTISSTLDNISAAYESSQERDQTSQVSREIFESSPGKLSTLVNKSRKGFKYINLKPGQTLFYHPGLVHGFSNDLVNFNKRQLAALAYYAAADCEFVDLRHSLSFGDQKQQQQQQQEAVPIGLAHFGQSNPRDYRSWLDKPRLVGEPKANL